MRCDFLCLPLGFALRDERGMGKVVKIPDLWSREKLFLSPTARKQIICFLGASSYSDNFLLGNEVVDLKETLQMVSYFWTYANHKL